MKYCSKRKPFLFICLSITILCVLARLLLAGNGPDIISASPVQLRIPEAKSSYQLHNHTPAGIVSSHSGILPVDPSRNTTCQGAHSWTPATDTVSRRCSSCGLMQGAAEGSVIGAGFYYTAVLTNDGTVLTSNKQVDASDFQDIVSISANSSGAATYAIGLKQDGTAVLALPISSSSYKFYDYKAIDVTDWRDLTAVAAGDGHAVGLKKDGTVIAVGSNDHGQCNVSSWTNIVAVSAGGSHTVGLRADGTVVTAGLNDNSQCSVSDWKDIVAVSAGAKFTAGLKADGTVVTSGFNRQEQVSSWNHISGISAGAYHLVGLKTDGTVVAADSSYSPKPRCKVSGWNDIVAISSGFLHTAALRSDGIVLCTGESPDHHGIYGKDNNVRLPCSTNLNATVERNTISAYGSDLIAIQKDGSVLSTNQGLDLSGFKNVESVVMGEEFALGLRSDGTVVFAATKQFYDCGQSEAAAWTNITALAAGYAHVVGLKDDGTVVAAGDNSYGQCDVSGWNNITAIDVSWDYPTTLGVTKSGTVLAAGRDSSESYAGWTDIVDIERGRMHTIGLKKDGSVICKFAYGMESTAQWEDITAICTCYDTVLGLKSNGTVVAAGETQFGHCSVSSWRDIAEIACGFSYSVGLKADGTAIFAGKWDQHTAQILNNARLP